jgi:DNA-binding MarR family transcriptional regulator
MTTRWLDDDERAAWVRLVAVVQLLPGVLESQLRRDADITHFEYWVLSMLSEAPERTLRMTSLAARTSSSLSRLSHVVARLEERDLVERFPCPDDRRATNARLTGLGWTTVVGAAPGHLETVREYVIDALTPRQIAALTGITEAILAKIDPDAAVTGSYRAALDRPKPDA